MATQRRTRRPSMQWDGNLYEPQTFGEGPKRGTVDWAKRERQNQAERRLYESIVAQREAEKAGPARWYLKSWPFVLVRAFGKLVSRLR